MTDESNGGFYEGWEVVSMYTRAQAIDDGTLVDVTAQAKQMGYALPVALTQTVWNRIEAIPEDRAGLESISGRMHDLLWMLSLALKRQLSTYTGRVNFASGEPLAFTFLLLEEGYPKTEDGEPDVEKCEVRLKVVSGPGDACEPVLTIMEPDED